MVVWLLVSGRKFLFSVSNLALLVVIQARDFVVFGFWTEFPPLSNCLTKLLFGGLDSLLCGIIQAGGPPVRYFGLQIWFAVLWRCTFGTRDEQESISRICALEIHVD